MTTEQGPPLDRLNAVERDLLSLLGRGHTAKSIADLRNLSVAAVNERFRSARRKTGLGSSREIARLIVAQENRHDFIDLAAPTPAPPEPPRQAAHFRASPLRRWRLPMLAAGLLAVAIFAQQTAVPTEPSAPQQPLHPAAAALFENRTPDPDLTALHAEAAGAPDPAWSPTTETSLLHAYRQATDASGELQALDVVCAAALCEVLGVARSGLSEAATNALMASIQSPAFREEAAAFGLRQVVTSFRSRRDDSVPDAPSGMIFASYWRRAD